MEIPTRFVIASNNEAKTAELIQCFKWLGATAISYQTLINRVNFPDEGTTSYLENATQKAQFMAQLLPNEWIVGDDSGMNLAAYPDYLGVLTARQLDIKKLTDAQLNQRVIQLVEGHSRAVQMQSYVVAIHNDIVISAKGIFKGRISTEPRGTNGHGFDLILQPDNHSQTLAQLSDREKIPLLHRTQAVKNLLMQLEEK